MRLGERHDGGDRRGGARLAATQRPDEALVDLDGVDRQPAEIAKRGIAGAEVVERDLHAHRPEPVERRANRRIAVDEDALGDLDLQSPRRQPGGQKRGLHVRAYVGETELDRRDVDRHHAVGGPARGLFAGAAQRNAPEFDDEPAFLSHRYEYRGRHAFAVGIAQAHQRLRADQAAGAQVNLRLKIEGQRPVGDRAAQVRVERLLFAPPRLHLR